MHTRSIGTGRRIDEQWTVSRDRLPIQYERVCGVGDKISKNAGKRRRCVHSRNAAECLIDRLRELRVLSLPTSEKECLALANGTAGFKPELMQLNVRFTCSLRIGEKLVGIECRVTHKLEQRSMKFIRAGARCYRDGSSAVATFFRRGIVRGDFVLLHIIG